MILDINRTMGSYVNSIGEPINTVLQGVGNLANRAIQQLHQNHNVAVVLYVVSNYAFMTLAQGFANSVQLNTEKYFENLTEKQRSIKNFLLNGVVIGSSAAIFNALLSKATQYPISRNVLAVIVIGTIAARMILKEAVNRYHEYLNLKTDLVSAQLFIEKMKADSLEISSEKEMITSEETQIEIDSLSESLEEATSRIKKLEVELKNAQTVATSDQADIDSQKAALNEIKAKFEESQNKVTSLTEALENAMGKPHSDNEIEYLDIKTQEEAAVEKALYVAEIQKLKSDIEVLKNELAVLTKERGETVILLEKSISDLEELNAYLTSENEELNNTLLEKGNELAVLTKGQEETVIPLKKAISHLEKLNTDLTGQIEVLKNSLFEKGLEIKQLEVFLEEKVGELERAQKSIASEAFIQAQLQGLIAQSEKELSSDAKQGIGEDQTTLLEQVKQLIFEKKKLETNLNDLQTAKGLVDQELRTLTANPAATESPVKDDHQTDGKGQQKRGLFKGTSFNFGSKTPKKG